MYFKVDFNSKLPLYEQIKSQIMYLISTGELESDAQLPSIRELAAMLKVNPTSTARAYRDLEYEKVVYSRKGLGTFVASSTAQDKTEKIKILSKKLDITVREALKTGLSENEINVIFTEITRKHIGEF
jgi:GntR family transcriptional regulator